MKYLILASILFISCAKQPEKKTQNFNEKTVDFLIDNCDDKFIEFPDLYDSLTKSIPKDQNEKLILVQILKQKGFKITNWGRGNHPLGPRIIVINMKKENCECEVQKIYYSSKNFSDSIYKTTESIKCKKAKK